MRSDANGIPNFMEVNPLAGLSSEHSDLPILSGMGGFLIPSSSAGSWTPR
jgi:D-alanine-D-alanine ligase